MSDPPIAFQIPDSGPPISKARLATVLWIVVETMVFAGLLGAFVIVRRSSPMWPPPYDVKGELVTPPRVDLEWPVINAGVLVSAFVIALLAQKAARMRDLMRCRLRLTSVSILGVIFCGIVLWEFIHEARRGVTVQAGPYGAYWMVITAAHAAHVLAGVVWLQVVLHGQRQLTLGAIDKDRVEHLGLYWGFITVVWIVLLVLLHVL